MPSLFKTICAVLCLVFALGFAAPNARADSIVESGGTISGIDAITILGTTYDVTFVHTTGPGPSPTFTTAADATTAVTDIDGDLNSLASFPNSIAQLGATFFLVPYPGGHDAVGECILFPIDCPSPSPGYSFIGLGTPVPVAHVFAELVPAAAPEPSSLLLMLAGAGLVSAMRKRSSVLQQAS